VHRRYSIRYIGGFGGGDFGNSMDFFGHSRRQLFANAAIAASRRI
jgi:hypothetical protein